MYKEGWSLTSLILIAGLLFLWLIKAPILSIFISEKTDLNVSMKMASVWPKVVTIRYFDIENPKKYGFKKAFKAKKITIEYSLNELLASPSIIDSVTLDDVVLNIFIKDSLGKDTNWTAIGSKLPKSKGKPVSIRKFVIKDMTVNIEGKGAIALGISGKEHFDQMEFDQIDGDEGFPTKELVTAIFQKAGFEKYIENFFNPTETIKDDLNPFNFL